MVMDDLMTLVKREQILSLFIQAYISRNTASWAFENVLIATTTIVMTDLPTWVK